MQVVRTQEAPTKHRSGRLRLVAALAAVAIGTVACGSGSTGPTRETSAPAAGSETSAPAGASDPAMSVRVVEFKYDPAEIEVAAGDTVQWTNEDTVLHTVTSGSFEGRQNQADGLFDLELEKKGSTVTHRFTEPGTFTYFCTRHNVMNGTVRVTA
ncbi:MAG TPA: plastocyanin/azurin family copper-binding protein [Actinomycetota bacterium]|nr:plastocyanin/azurin family copper-binding protein [Actinomycetota bacterium]